MVKKELWRKKLEFTPALSYVWSSYDEKRLNLAPSLNQISPPTLLCYFHRDIWQLCYTSVPKINNYLDTLLWIEKLEPTPPYNQVSPPTLKVLFPYSRLASNWPACIATGVSSGFPSIISPIAYILGTLVCSQSSTGRKPFLKRIKYEMIIPCHYHLVGR